MTLTDNERAVPFGAVVTLVGDESSSFIVGDRGQVYLTGMREEGTLVATWGSQPSQQCRADFSLPTHSTFGGIADMRASCRQER